MQFSEIQKPRGIDLDLGSGHMAYRRALLIDTTNFIEIGKKNFFVDGLTAGTPPSSMSRDT